MSAFDIYDYICKRCGEVQYEEQLFGGAPYIAAFKQAKESIFISDFDLFELDNETTAIKCYDLLCEKLKSNKDFKLTILCGPVLYGKIYGKTKFLDLIKRHFEIGEPKGIEDAISFIFNPLNPVETCDTNFMRSIVVDGNKEIYLGNPKGFQTEFINYMQISWLHLRAFGLVQRLVHQRDEFIRQWGLARLSFEDGIEMIYRNSYVHDVFMDKTRGWNFNNAVELEMCRNAWFAGELKSIEPYFGEYNLPYETEKGFEANPSNILQDETLRTMAELKLFSVDKFNQDIIEVCRRLNIIRNYLDSYGSITKDLNLTFGKESFCPYTKQTALDENTQGLLLGWLDKARVYSKKVNRYFNQVIAQLGLQKAGILVELRPKSLFELADKYGLEIEALVSLIQSAKDAALQIAYFDCVEEVDKCFEKILPGLSLKNILYK